jgi:hypothetical protein
MQEHKAKLEALEPNDKRIVREVIKAIRGLPEGLKHEQRR